MFSASYAPIWPSFPSPSPTFVPATQEEEVDVRDVNFNLSSDEEDNGAKDEEEEEEDPFSGSGTMEVQADGVMALVSPHVSNLVHNPSDTQVRPTRRGALLGMGVVKMLCVAVGERCHVCRASNNPLACVIVPRPRMRAGRRAGYSSG